MTKHLKIVPVKWIDEVLDLALERPLPAQARGGAKPAAASKGKARGRAGGRPAVQH